VLDGYKGKYKKIDVKLNHYEGPGRTEVRYNNRYRKKKE